MNFIHHSTKKTLLSLAMLGTFLGVVSACKDPDSTEQQAKVAPAIEPQYQSYLALLVERQLRPVYQQMAAESAKLKTYMNAACDTKEEQDWQAAQQSWQQTMNHWQQVKWMRLGPIDETNQYHRLQFWPDNNDAVERGVMRLLTSEQLPSVEKFSNLNVGAQGLPAMESVIFEHSYTSSVDRQKRCEVATLIATNIRNIADKVNVAWQQEYGFSQQLIQGTGQFSGPKDAVEELLSDVLAQLTLIKDNKIIIPLSFQSPGIPLLAESPFANHSTANLQHNMRALQGILTGDEAFGLDNLLVSVGADNIAQQLVASLNQIMSLVNKLPRSYVQALEDEQSRQTLKQLVEQISELQSLLVTQVVPTLELNLGFNALDGD